MLFSPSGITFEAALRDLHSKNPRTRAVAAHALGDVTDPTERQKAVPALIEALRDPRPEVRTEAAFALGELSSEAAVEPLAISLDDPTPVVRQGCAMALGKLGFDAGFAPLAKALKDGPADVRFQAATSLVEIDPARAYEPLVAALDDDDAEVAGAAAVGLGAIGDPRAADRLAGLLDHHARRTRLDAAYALADLGDRRGLEVLLGAASDPELGWDALDGLGRIGRPDDADAVAELMTPELDMPLALKASALLLRLDPGHRAAVNARDTLLRGLELRKLEQRGLAVQLIGQVGGRWALAALQDLRRKRRGKHLQDEIDEALAALRAGGRDGGE